MLNQPSSLGGVLVVEDDLGIAGIVREIFEGERVPCAMAELGKDALAVLRERPAFFKLILLDIRLPDMDGWEILEALRADAQLSSIPVVIWSGASDVVTQARADEAGIPFLKKPVRYDELMEVVRRYV